MEMRESVTLKEDNIFFTILQNRCPEGDVSKKYQPCLLMKLSTPPSAALPQTLITIQSISLSLSRLRETDWK